jgi:hypothetical protein
MKSVVENADNISDVEFLIKVDDDDIDSGYPQMLSDQFKGINYTLFVEGRSSNLSQDYYNYLAKQAKGQYIWAVNDDCVLRVPQWDTIFRDLIDTNKTDGKIYYFNVSVAGHSVNDFSPFPMVSKEFVEALGYFHHELIRTWDADIIMWNCFNTLKGVYGINRMISASAVNVYHINHAGDIGDATQQGMKDGHMKDGGFNAGVFNDHGLYYVVAEKLKAAIDNGK